ncbi:SAM-dependent methyltransferase [Streptomyces sp. NPDC101062]|uniref:SAM-dependent methyltransferase n=1 Tax=unclassified Streptomyces TaxID=2593676 RepID=UPI00382D9092
MPENNTPPPARPRIDTSRASPARTYNEYNGGKDSYLVDQQVRLQMEELGLEPGLIARENRKFHGRAVRTVAEMGIDQILDIGTGVPQSPNTHEIAQAVKPSTRVLYVDNDPIVVRHAEALLASGPEGATFYAEADAREPADVLAAASEHLDLQRPVVVLMIALLHFVEDNAGDPRHIVRTVMDAMAPGSVLVLTHMIDDHDPDTWRSVETIYRAAGIPAQIRPYEQVQGFFKGLELLGPGLLPVTQWRPDPADDSVALKPGLVPIYGALAVKPA